MRSQLYVRRRVLWMLAGALVGCAISFFAISSYYVFLAGGKLPSFSYLFKHLRYNGRDDMHLDDEDYENMPFPPPVHDGLPANGLLAKTYPVVGNDLTKLMDSTIRILCLCLTTSKYHLLRAIHVKKTWGRRCTRLIFISDDDEPELGAIAISKGSGYGEVWGKVRAAFKFTHDNYLNDFDWFFKVDDDTYAVMENLRLLLARYSPDEAIYLGRLFKPYVKQGYMSGGAGYVLSRKALKLLVTEGFRQPKYCSAWTSAGAEDAEIGKCLDTAGVRTIDTRDAFGKQRFNPFPPEDHLTNGRIPPGFWVRSYDMNGYVEGPECCSDFAVTFHYIKPKEMYLLEYLIYRLNPYGLSGQLQALSSDLDNELTWSPVTLISEMQKSAYSLPKDLLDKVIQSALPDSNDHRHTEGGTTLVTVASKSQTRTSTTTPSTNKSATVVIASTSQ